MTAAIGRAALQATHRTELLHQVISVTPRDLAAPASKVIAFPGPPQPPDSARFNGPHGH